MFISFVALARVWQRDGVTDDNRISTSFSELWVYPIPAGLYLIKNLMQVRPVCRGQSTVSATGGPSAAD